MCLEVAFKTGKSLRRSDRDCSRPSFFLSFFQYKSTTLASVITASVTPNFTPYSTFFSQLSLHAIRQTTPPTICIHLALTTYIQL